jgi:TetR/AcrR family transcriptional regulator, transcriptional repressor for nem operon
MPRAQRQSGDRGTRDRILRHGRQIVTQAGLRGLTVRKLAARAHVNLGTFVYHFGTRDAFITELMEGWYAPLYTRLKLTADEQLAPLARLHRFLLQFASFLVENRPLVRNLILDAFGGERAALKFIRSLAARHPALLFELIRQAQEAGELPAGDPLQAGIFLAGATVLPSIWIGILLPKDFIPAPMRSVVQQLAVAPEQIDKRFAWALDGVAQRPTPAKGKST